MNDNFPCITRVNGSYLCRSILCATSNISYKMVFGLAVNYTSLTPPQLGAISYKYYVRRYVDSSLYLITWTVQIISRSSSSNQSEQLRLIQFRNNCKVKHFIFYSLTSSTLNICIRSAGFFLKIPVSWDLALSIVCTAQDNNLVNSILIEWYRK